jgi:glycosyltransferase involved in cell wall biosynthesis
VANARLKVLFLIISYDAPSSRIRCTDMQDLLEAQGIDVEITEVPDRVIARFRLFRRASEFDAVVLQKKILRWFDITMLKSFANRLIYDVDDAVYHRDAPCGAAVAAYQHPGRARRFRGVVRRVDAVIAANRVLAEEVQRLTPDRRVAVIASGIETSKLPSKTDYSLCRPPAIGWVGTTATQKYLTYFLPALRQVHAEHPFELRVLSDRPPEIPDLDVCYIPWTLAGQNAAIAEFDIGIMPLSNDPFAAGKSAYKLLQYMAAGVPAVCSAVGMNVDISADNGNCLAATTQDEFAGHILQLLSDERMRETLGQNGRQLIKQKFSMERLSTALAQEIKDICLHG